MATAMEHMQEVGGRVAHRGRKMVIRNAPIPSLALFSAGLAAVAASAALEGLGKTKWSRFTGQIAPSLMLLGLYTSRLS